MLYKDWQLTFSMKSNLDFKRHIQLVILDREIYGKLKMYDVLGSNFNPLSPNLTKSFDHFVKLVVKWLNASKGNYRRENNLKAVYLIELINVVYPRDQY